MTTEICASLQFWRSYVKWVSLSCDGMDKAAFLLEDAREIAVIPYLILGQLLETTNILSLEINWHLILTSFWLLFPGPILSSTF